MYAESYLSGTRRLQECHGEFMGSSVCGFVLRAVEPLKIIFEPARIIQENGNLGAGRKIFWHSDFDHVIICDIANSICMLDCGVSRTKWFIAGGETPYCSESRTSQCLASHSRAAAVIEMDFCSWKLSDIS